MVFLLHWVNADDVPFVQDYAVEDESVFSIDWEHKEGAFAALSVTIRNPRVSLLSPLRPQYAYLSYRADGDANAIPFFFGWVVGIPTSVLDELVTVEMIAEPLDFTEQCEALAAAMREQDEWDDVLVEPESRLDPDAVLECFPRRWFTDPVDLEVSTSHVLVGEAGEVEFTADEHFKSDFDLSWDGIPLNVVNVSCTFPWVQSDQGDVDFTDYFLDRWPNESFVERGFVTSFTLGDNDWPQVGTSIGDGWEVSESSFIPKYNLAVQSKSFAPGDLTIHWPDSVGGGSIHITSSRSVQYLNAVPPGSISLPSVRTQLDIDVQYGDLPAYFHQMFGILGLGGRTWTHVSENESHTDGLIPLKWYAPTLVAHYVAERPHEETVTFSLRADVQQIVSRPGNSASLDLNLRSVSLSDPIDPNDPESEKPIGDLRSRWYVGTERGLRTVLSMIARAAAPLIRRSRAARIKFQPVDFKKFLQLTLRHNVRIYDPRIPGGSAVGKVTALSVSMDGDDGVVECSVEIGCAIGRGGTVTEVAGEPTWVEDGWVEDGWQERSGRRTVAFESSVGFELPRFNPNDDGLDFVRGVEHDQLFDADLVVTNGPASQRAAVDSNLRTFGVYKMFSFQAQQTGGPQGYINSRSEFIGQVLNEVPLSVSFKLKSMKSKITSSYTLMMTDLKIPNMLPLEG